MSVLCLVVALSDCTIKVSSYSGGELLLTRFHVLFFLSIFEKCSIYRSPLIDKSMCRR